MAWGAGGIELQFCLQMNQVLADHVSAAWADAANHVLRIHLASNENRPEPCSTSDVEPVGSGASGAKRTVCSSTDFVLVDEKTLTFDP